MREFSEEIQDKFARHVNPSFARLVKFMGIEGIESHAQGCLVFDTDGNDYLDCLGGFGVFNLGHRPEKVIQAVQDQLAKMPLSSKLLFNAPQAELASLLAEISPPGLEYCFFCNSGAEAIEGALKLARAATGRAEFVSAVGAFHGKTFGALSVSGREIYKSPFAPLLPDCRQVPFGEGPALADVVSEKTAAVILEPIQGEGGIIVPPEGYLRTAREVCDRSGACLILDEVQTGLGRTGALFAANHEGVAPDLMTLGKALGGGVMPIGAILGTAETWEIFEENPLIHSTTFGGNPLACRAGLAAVNQTVEENLPKEAARKGQTLLDEFGRLRSAHPDRLMEVRGKGLMIGLEFSDPDLAGLFIAGLLQQRILAAYTLNTSKVVRLEPPLIISGEEIERLLKGAEAAFKYVENIISELA